MIMQEPGANASEIYSVLRHVRPGDNFVPNFEMFAKSDVNGKDQNPIYEFLKSRCPSVRAEFQASYKLYYEPYHQDDIRWGDTNHLIKKIQKFQFRWNFEKFLVNHQGQPVRRYDESLDPSELVSILVEIGIPYFSPHAFSRSQILTFFWASASWTLQSKPSLIENLSLQKKPLLTCLMTSLDKSLAVLRAMVLPMFWPLCIRVFVLLQCCWGRGVQ